MSPNPVSSNPILRRTLIWSGVATVILAVVAGTVGFLVGQGEGLISGLLGVLLAMLFLAITGISILIANRWFGQPLYVQLFFAIVMGGWLLKLGVFLVVMIVLSGQPWIHPMVFFLSIVAGVIMSLAIDVLVLTRMRLPNVSDASLPTEAPEDRAPGVFLPTEVPEDRAPGRHHTAPERPSDEGSADSRTI
jgi:drug/metabolite transporter (DMT)-like permease